MSNWRIVKPKASLNLCSNPILKYSITGYAAIGAAAVSRIISDKARHGPWVLSCTSGLSTTGVEAPTYPMDDFYSFGCFLTILSGTVNVYITRVSGTVRILVGSYAYTDGNPVWVQFDHISCLGVTDYRMSFLGAATFLVGSVFYELGSELSTFIDGDLPGCKWMGNDGESSSSRSAYTREGGELIDPDDIGLLVTGDSDIGMAPVDLSLQPMASMNGSVFDGSNSRERTIVLISRVIGTGLVDLHARRKAITSLIQPDLVPDDQPVILRYLGANESHPVEIRTYYAGGLEKTSSPSNSEKIAVRLVAADPFFYDIWDTIFPLWTSTVSITPSYAIRQNLETGEWEPVGSLNGTVWCFVENKFHLYMGGAFTTLDGFTVNRVADLGAISTDPRLGSGLNGTVYCMALDAAGNLYVGGTFSTAGGGASPGIAKWNGSVWTALGSGLSGGGAYAKSIIIDASGNLYAAGNFTSAGGVAANNIAKWNGSVWTALGTGLNSTGEAVILDNDKMTILVGGSFTTANGVTVNRIAKWNGTTFIPLGSGMNGVVMDIDVSSNLITACGDFTTSGGVTTNRVAQWNGSSWKNLSSGVGASLIQEVFRDEETQFLYFAGNFMYVGGLLLTNRVVMWNGYSWAPLEMPRLPGSPSISTVHKTLHGSYLYFGYDTTGTVDLFNNGVINNPGSRSVSPKLTVTRPGGTSLTLGVLVNHTTQRFLWLNKEILIGETVDIEMGGDIPQITSSIFGNIPQAILRGSDFTNFEFLPGDNYYTFCSPYVGAGAIGIGTAWFSWRGRHSGVDGAAL